MAGERKNSLFRNENRKLVLDFFMIRMFKDDGVVFLEV